VEKNSDHPCPGIGSGRKSILDIQREEAAQGKRREEQEASQAAAHAAAVASAPSQGPSSWGKTVLRVVPSAGRSLERDLEKTRRC
jgi:hypothetical protein